MKIEGHTDSEINRLIVAINHYVSTGNHIGEGYTMPQGDRLLVIIPVNRTLIEDRADFAAFRARYDELRVEYDLELTGAGAEGEMDMHLLSVPATRVDALATALRERPGPRGWGSPKAMIDQHGLDEHGRPGGAR